MNRLEQDRIEGRDDNEPLYGEYAIKDSIERLCERSQLEEFKFIKSPTNERDKLRNLRIGQVVIARSSVGKPYESAFFVAEGAGIESVLYRMLYLKDGKSAKNTYHETFFLESSPSLPLVIDVDTFNTDDVILVPNFKIPNFDSNTPRYLLPKPKLTILQFCDQEIIKYAAHYTQHTQTSEHSLYLAGLAGIVLLGATRVMGTSHDVQTFRNSLIASLGALLFAGGTVALSRLSNSWASASQHQLRERFCQLCPEDTVFTNFISSVMAEEE